MAIDLKGEEVKVILKNNVYRRIGQDTGVRQESAMERPQQTCVGYRYF